MCTKDFLIGLTTLLILSLGSCNTRFNKEQFLSECQFSIEDNILSENDEYTVIYADRTRDPQTDSLYKLFYQTHDYSLNLNICRSFGKGTFMRPWGRGSDSLLIDDFFAHAIKSSTNRDELIELVLIYGWDKPYSYQKLISEVCLKPKYYVNDSLKYIALNYALESNYYQEDCQIKEDYDIELIRKIGKERMAIAPSVYGEESAEAYRALFEYAQLTQFDGGTDTSVADSLFRYHETHIGKYRNGAILDLYADPLYLRYLSSFKEGDIIHAAEILAFLTENISFDEEHKDNLLYSEAQIMLLYENARFAYFIGQQKEGTEHKDDYKVWLELATAMNRSYLSPIDRKLSIAAFLEPDHVFDSYVLDLMAIAYNTPSSKEAYDIALFLKGTSALITRDLIKIIKEQGDSELIAYVDSIRQNHRGSLINNQTYWTDIFTDPDILGWIDKRNNIAKKLDYCLSTIDPEDFWLSCSVTTEDVYDSLKPNESAIEIIKTYPFSGGDSVYEALILNYGEPTPIRIKICDRKRLIEFIHDGHFYDNASEVAYDNLVKPIMTNVTGKTVYLASDGLFSLINYSSITDGHGMRTSDKWNIVPCITTKTICELKDIEEPVISSIAIFGGLEYEPGNKEPHYSQDNKVTRDIEQEWFGYLPATLKEVETIDEIATHNNINSYLYTGLEGTEKAFLSLSGKEIPIIHIATHGYYYDIDDPQLDNFYLQSGNDAGALNRCGLVLADSQHVLEDGIDIYDNNNGVIVGSEIANLDLTGTDLVVLSACNTALGDISSEGVIGLQMAFKRAGVHSILMTLGKVDDEATAYFMTSFYEKLFNGEDKHSSFRGAIEAMRNSERFSDPKYWSQYTLID